MSAATAEFQELTLSRREPASPPPIHVTERATKAIQSIVNQQRVERLQELAPDFVEPLKSLQATQGGSPTLAEKERTEDSLSEARVAEAQI